MTGHTKNALAVGLASPAAAEEIETALQTVGGAGDPLSLGAISSTGLLARTGAGTSAARTLTGTANQVTIVNGNGVSGNPTVSLPATPSVTTGYAVAGTKVVGAQAAVIATCTIAATTGSLPTPDGATTIADAAAPTVDELLEALVELKAKFDAVLAVLKTHGLIASA